MTHNTDKVGFPSIPLRNGMVLKLEARNPTTDAEVAGVTCTRWSIYGYDDSAEPPPPGPEGPVFIVQSGAPSV